MTKTFTTTSIANVENEEEVKNLFLTAEHYSNKEQCTMYVMSNGETAVVIHDDYKEEFKEKGYWLAAMYKSGYRVDLF